jgi:hypothetical protein
MKKLLILLLITANLAYAQHYRKFRVAFDFGSPIAGTSSLGVFAYEPSYRINDNVLVGFRIEQMGILSTIGSANKSLGSFAITSHYYLNKNFFIGGGLGLYSPTNANSKDEKNGVGFFPRVGFECGHFHTTMEWNITQHMRVYENNDAYPGIETSSYTNRNYLTLKAGFFIGGGKKNKQ